MFRLRDGGFMVLERQKELQPRGEDCWKTINRPPFDPQMKGEIKK